MFQKVFLLLEQWINLHLQVFCLAAALLKLEGVSVYKMSLIFSLLIQSQFFFAHDGRKVHKVLRGSVRLDFNRRSKRRRQRVGALRS